MGHYRRVAVLGPPDPDADPEEVLRTSELLTDALQPVVTSNHHEKESSLT